jgi:hypothetical protein
VAPSSNAELNIKALAQTDVELEVDAEYSYYYDAAGDYYYWDD